MQTVIKSAEELAVEDARLAELSELLEIGIIDRPELAVHLVQIVRDGPHGRAWAANGNTLTRVEIRHLEHLFASPGRRLCGATRFAFRKGRNSTECKRVPWLDSAIETLTSIRFYAKRESVPLRRFEYSYAVDVKPDRSTLSELEDIFDRVERSMQLHENPVNQTR